MISVEKLMWIPGLFPLFLVWSWQDKTWGKYSYSQIDDITLMHGIYSGFQIIAVLFYMLML